MLLVTFKGEELSAPHQVGNELAALAFCKQYQALFPSLTIVESDCNYDILVVRTILFLNVRAFSPLTIGSFPGACFTDNQPLYPPSLYFFSQRVTVALCA